MTDYDYEFKYKSKRQDQIIVVSHKSLFKRDMTYKMIITIENGVINSWTTVNNDYDLPILWEREPIDKLIFNRFYRYVILKEPLYDMKGMEFVYENFNTTIKWRYTTKLDN